VNESRQDNSRPSEEAMAGPSFWWRRVAYALTAYTTITALAALPGVGPSMQAQDTAATIAVDVKVVTLPVTVRDKHGKIVRDLTKDDFTLQEDGRPQSIRYFSQETNLPLTLGLLVDTSRSMAFAARGQVTPKSALAGRYEYFKDETGWATSKKQNLNEFTATYEYKYAAGLLARVEYRDDISNVNFFSKQTNSGSTPGAVKSQSTFTVGLVAFFGPKR